MPLLLLAGLYSPWPVHQSGGPSLPAARLCCTRRGIRGHYTAPWRTRVPGFKARRRGGAAGGGGRTVTPPPARRVRWPALPAIGPTPIQPGPRLPSLTHCLPHLPSSSLLRSNIHPLFLILLFLFLLNASRPFTPSFETRVIRSVPRQTGKVADREAVWRVGGEAERP